MNNYSNIIRLYLHVTKERKKSLIHNQCLQVYNINFTKVLLYTKCNKLHTNAEEFIFESMYFF
jgi:hypothetical protein